MDELNAAMLAGTSDAVKLWMNWMMLVFLASLAFVWKHKSARMVLLALLLTMPLGYAIWKTTANIHLLGVAHFIVWVPLALYLYMNELRQTHFQYKSVYGIWLCLLMMTIATSLVFDVRDVFLVMTGVK